MWERSESIGEHRQTTFELSLDKPCASWYNLRWLLRQADGTVRIRTLKRIICRIESPLRCDGHIFIPLATAALIIIALAALVQYCFAMEL